MLAQEYDLDDPELAEAFAVLAQQKKGSAPSPGAWDTAQQTFGFTRRRETRKNAGRFLKTVTPCTSCAQHGHWAGDQECPNRGRKGKGQGIKKKPVPKKRGGHSSMFVESPAEPGGETDFVHEALISFGGMLSEGTPGTFSNRFEMGNHEGEALMVLRNHDLCEHAEYNGGNEKRLHRSANGFTRSIMCKEPECSGAIIQAHFKDATELWKYMAAVWCSQVMPHALANQPPMRPEIYRFAFYLYA